MNTLILKLKVFKLSLKPMLGLFSADNLLVESLNGLLSLSQSTSQLLLVALKLINPTKAFGLKLGLPELNLSLSLGESLQGIRFLLRFFFNALPQVFKLKRNIELIKRIFNELTDINELINSAALFLM
jgi:hypothetical protein